MSRPASGDEETLSRARELIASAQTVEQLRQAQAVVLPLDHSLSLADTARVIGLSIGWACQLRRRFIRGQTAGSADAPSVGGRRRQNMSVEQEREFLAPFFEQAACGGILVALWDIKGKALNVPVHELLGGPVRNRIRVYSWIGGDRPADTAAAAQAAVARGFSAVKMNGSEELQYIDSHAKVEQAVANVQAVRDARGAAHRHWVDFHGRVHKPMAKVLMRRAARSEADVHRGARAQRTPGGDPGAGTPSAPRHRPGQRLYALGFQARVSRRAGWTSSSPTLRTAGAASTKPFKIAAMARRKP
ncbi:hypothetical protein FQA39_LY18671 [Lamprigera yunnana]|nr:hypothetical protein FQA39_LY18671 [Lamprigera yunnana]